MYLLSTRIFRVLPRIFHALSRTCVTDVAPGSKIEVYTTFQSKIGHFML